MEFSFNNNQASAYPFFRIDLYLYKFTDNKNSFYKLDFKPIEIKHTIPSYKNYKTFKLQISGRFSNLRVPDKKILQTCLQIIRDFLQQKITAKAMLLKQNKLLNDDLFELKNRFNLKGLEVLFNNYESIVYLVKDI